jgi:hypothetical protein
MHSVEMKRKKADFNAAKAIEEESCIHLLSLLILTPAFSSLSLCFCLSHYVYSCLFPIVIISPFSLNNTKSASLRIALDMIKSALPTLTGSSLKERGRERDA